MWKHSGFTLSETLVTLAIIGVIAVLILPSLVNTAGRKQLDAQVEKAYYTLNEALDLVKAENASVPKCYLGYDFTNSQVNAGLNNFSGCSTFFTKFVKKINTAKVCSSGTSGCAYDGFNAYSGSSSFVTSDGMLFVLKSESEPIYMVDVNGAKGPNKWGFDIYTFALYGDEYTANFEPDAGMSVASGGKSAQEVLKGTED